MHKEELQLFENFIDYKILIYFAKCQGDTDKLAQLENLAEKSKQKLLDFNSICPPHQFKKVKGDFLSIFTTYICKKCGEDRTI